jgi:hypothetical protein
MLDDAGDGGGVATMTGELTCLGVVTVAFVRRTKKKGCFDRKERVERELTIRTARDGMMRTARDCVAVRVHIKYGFQGC